ncbi:MAG: glutamyl-tRNA reductase [Gammaproteobacteria bacterium]|nr:glutamyl-tRNA reductase [Gammaproteobacteria bacterium]
MPLLALGLNHRTAPVAIRETTVFAPDKLDIALQELMAVPDVQEAAIISTCNRTEIYCRLSSEQPDRTLAWFLDHHGMHDIDHDSCIYRFIDKKTVQHLFRVACGLDSMVLGEPQILGQLKSAYRHAEQAGTLGLQLSRLFQHAFSVAKQVRSETTIGTNPVSVAYAAVRMTQQIFSDLNQLTVLLIGAGETIELAARHFQQHGVENFVIANRTLERGETLTKKFGGTAIRLGELGDYLHQADIVLTSTASQLPIIGKGAVEAALRLRKHKPMFMLDIAVPRDIEPQVGQLADVYLYNVDDLQTVIDENRRSREVAAEKAETIVDLQVENFINWQRSLEAVYTIRKYRENAREISQLALEKAKRMLAQGKDPVEVLEQLSNMLTNKLLHAATKNLDRAAREGRDDLLQAAHELFSSTDKENKN